MSTSRMRSTGWQRLATATRREQTGAEGPAAHALGSSTVGRARDVDPVAPTGAMRLSRGSRAAERSGAIGAVDDGGPIRLARREWLALHTPGHHRRSPLPVRPRPDGVMLSGDHVLPTITPHIGRLRPVPDPLACFFDSPLDKVAFLGPDTSICLPRTLATLHNNCPRVGRNQTPHLERLDTIAVGIRGHRPGRPPR